MSWLAVQRAMRRNGYSYLEIGSYLGGSLQQHLSGDPLPPRVAAEIIATLAGAMDFAHQRGIVHRDLKPENVFITVDDRVKLLDFGLAKLQLDDVNLSSTVERLTDPNAVMICCQGPSVSFPAMSAGPRRR